MSTIGLYIDLDKTAEMTRTLCKNPTKDAKFF